MGKGKGNMARPGPQRGGGGGGGGDMMARLQQVQAQMQQAQVELADEYISVTSGGAAVTIEISGVQRVRAVRIAPEFLQSGDAEMLGDILVVAMNAALEQSQGMAAGRLGPLTGKLSLPGMYCAGRLRRARCSAL